METALLLVGCLLAGLTVGIALIIAHPDTTPSEAQAAGGIGGIVFVLLVVVAALLGGAAVFGS